MGHVLLQAPLSDRAASRTLTDPPKSLKSLGATGTSGGFLLTNCLLVLTTATLDDKNLTTLHRDGVRRVTNMSPMPDPRWHLNTVADASKPT